MRKLLIGFYIVFLLSILSACSTTQGGLIANDPSQDTLGVGDAAAGAVGGYGSQVADALGN